MNIWCFATDFFDCFTERHFVAGESPHHGVTVCFYHGDVLYVCVK